MKTRAEFAQTDAVRHWYWPLILGILLVVAGVWVFATPVAAYVTLALLFAYTFLVSGVLEIIHAIANRRTISRWGWSLAGGIVDLAVGILLVSHPTISMLALPFYVGFGILFRSVMAIGWAFEIRKSSNADWGGLLVIGILGLLLSFILIWNPMFAGLTIVFYTGLAFIAMGIFQVYLAFKLKSMGHRRETTDRFTHPSHA